MARIDEGMFKNWANGDRMNPDDYKRERELLRAAVNDVDDKVSLLQPQSVEDIKNEIDIAKGDSGSLEERFVKNENTIGDVSQLEQQSIVDALKDKDQKIGTVTEQLDIKTKGNLNLAAYESMKVAVADGYNWTAALQKAIDDADSGQVIELPPSDTNYIFTKVSAKGKSVFLKGHSEKSVKVMQVSNESVFDLTGSWGNVQNITSFALSEYPISNAITTVTKITLSAPPVDLALNDIIKVHSDDLIPFSHDYGNRRKGEFAMIAGISGNDIYLSGLLRESYLNKPRLAKLNPVSFGISNMSFGTLLSEETLQVEPILRVSSAMNCRFNNIHCENGYGSFLQLRSIFGYTVNGLTAKNLDDDTSMGHWGYGIQDSSCEHGIVTSSNFYNCRHAFTTNAISSSNLTDPTNFGYSAHTIVTNCTSFGATTGAFDTHPECFNIKFSDCVSTNGAGGFSARGKYVEFDNCHSMFDRMGFHIMNTDAGGTENIRVIDCTAKFSTLRALNLIGTNGYINGIHIEGGEFDVTNNESVVRVDKVEVHFKNVKFTQKYTVGFSRIFYLGNESKITFEDIKCDLTLATGESSRVFYFDGSNISVKGNGLTISEHTNTKFIAIANAGVLNPELRLANVFTNKFVFNSVYNIENYKLDYRSGELNASGRAFNEIYLDLSVGGESPILDKILSDTIYLRVKAVGADRSIGSFPMGNKSGQILVIRNSGSGSYKVTIPPSITGTNRTQKAAIDLLEGDTIMFMFVGGFWIHINKV